MLGPGFQIDRNFRDDRFYNHRNGRINNDKFNNQKNPQFQRNFGNNNNFVNGDRNAGGGNYRGITVFSHRQPKNRVSNVERFLEGVTPHVHAQFLSKTTMAGKTRDVEYEPYFLLSDLWESFKEWSAYGTGVPLVLNGSDSVVQYYVPYLSGIQIFVDPSRSPPDSRQTSEVRNGGHINRPSNGGNNESETSRGSLLFQYFEYDPPFCRGPLIDKISDLALRFPELRSLRSCDLLPSSWLSVAWYPIYRIPMGPTLNHLDACFLTYHSLYTPVGDAVASAQAPVLSYSDGIDSNPRIALPVFGLASYKFRGTMWTANNGSDCQLVNSLLQAADAWLRLLQVNHPDYLFFRRSR